jgi:ankyrin repeat protein
MLRKALVSLPKTLDDTYARILDNIDDEHQANALKLLQWLTYSARPLRIQELAEIVTVDKMDVEDEPEFDSDRRFPEPRDVLALCSSLVSTVTTTLQEDMGGSEDSSESEEAGWGSEEAVENPIELVRLAHFSVKEYLVSERIQAGSARRYCIREIDAHLSIAETCLAYLFQFDQPGSLTLQTLKESPLANYAAEYWPEHARWAGKEHKGMHQLIMKLFVSKKDAYFNSIKIHDPESGRSWPDLTLKLTDIPPPLYYALCFGLAESTRLLVEAGVDINAEGQHDTALQMAAIEGDDHLAKKLLAAGADVNAKGRYGTALQIAAVNGHDHIVQRLLDAGADVNAEGLYGTALQRAAGNGHDHLVQRLVDAGADINVKGLYGTALQRAAGNGHNRIVQRLVDAGADVNAKGLYGTALRRAAENGRDYLVQRLLDAGADVNQGGPHTALRYAKSRGHDDIVQRLLKAGAED